MARSFKMLGGAIFLASLFFTISCKSKSESETFYYKQPFTSNVAFMAIERFGKPNIMASGSLENRNAGIFSTAKHFTENLEAMGVGKFKIFFNRRVYEGELAKVSYLHDATLVAIVSQFSPEDFPEPLPVASRRPIYGEKVYIEGFHPHPYWLREINKSDGFPDMLVSILNDYYGIVMFDLTKESQVVHHNLEGTVYPPDPNPLVPDMKQYENNSFIKVRMKRDHKYSFGGLSGGIAKNEKGEVVGIITAQDIYRFEFDEGGLLIPNVGVAVSVKNQFYDTIYVTPVDLISDLYEYARKVR